MWIQKFRFSYNTISTVALTPPYTEEQAKEVKFCFNCIKIKHIFKAFHVYLILTMPPSGEISSMNEFMSNSSYLVNIYNKNFICGISVIYVGRSKHVGRPFRHFS